MSEPIGYSIPVSARVAELLSIGEQPAEHIRNALQLLAGVIGYDGAELSPLTADTLTAIRERLQAAALSPDIATPALEQVASALELVGTIPDPALDLSNTLAGETRRDVLQALRFSLNAALHAHNSPAAPDPAELARLGVVDPLAIGRPSGELAGDRGDAGDAGDAGTLSGGDSNETAPATSSEPAPPPRPITEGTGFCHCAECEAIRSHNSRNVAPAAIQGLE